MNRLLLLSFTYIPGYIAFISLAKVAKRDFHKCHVSVDNIVRDCSYQTNKIQINHNFIHTKDQNSIPPSSNTLILASIAIRGYNDINFSELSNGSNFLSKLKFSNQDFLSDKFLYSHDVGVTDTHTMMIARTPSEMYQKLELGRKISDMIKGDVLNIHFMDLFGESDIDIHMIEAISSAIQLSQSNLPSFKKKATDFMSPTQSTSTTANHSTSSTSSSSSFVINIITTSGANSNDSPKLSEYILNSNNNSNNSQNRQKQHQQKYQVYTEYLNNIQKINQGTHMTRVLSMYPPNYLHPKSYTATIQALVQAYTTTTTSVEGDNYCIEYTEWTPDELKAIGCGAFYAVTEGNGPSNERLDRLICLKYTPPPTPPPSPTTKASSNSNSGSSTNNPLNSRDTISSTFSSVTTLSQYYSRDPSTIPSEFLKTSSTSIEEKISESLPSTSTSSNDSDSDSDSNDRNNSSKDSINNNSNNSDTSSDNSNSKSPITRNLFEEAKIELQQDSTTTAAAAAAAVISSSSSSSTTTSSISMTSSSSKTEATLSSSLSSSTTTYSYWSSNSEINDSNTNNNNKSRRDPLRPVVLVGKGVCYDTGGINIKSANSMKTMKHDMAGSAAALSTFFTLLETKFPYPVECWLAIAENNIDKSAMRPDDVITAVTGDTIEIVHTDAEGRLLLADTLALASRQVSIPSVNGFSSTSPALLIDFATLTGTCISSLTNRYIGAFTNRDEYISTLIQVGQQCGERVWPFPLDDDYHEDLKSDIADILQCRQPTEGDHIYAASFLKKFIRPTVPWIHLDMASAYRPGGLGVSGSDYTGCGPRLAIHLIKQYGL